jgi:hypothetical protein
MSADLSRSRCHAGHNGSETRAEGCGSGLVVAGCLAATVVGAGQALRVPVILLDAGRPSRARSGTVVVLSTA